VALGIWRTKGIRFLVTGLVEPGSEGTHRVSFEVIDILSGQSEFGQSYRGVKLNGLRYAAHLVSNDIHRHLLGQHGVFDSSIAYIAIDEQNEQRRWSLIYADADGANPIALLTEERPLMSPAFSADGRQLAYVSFATRRAEIVIRDVFDVGSRSVASVEGLNSAPAWSPDGRQLAVAQSREGAINIFVIDVANGNRRQLTDHWGIDTEPTWTPDGRHILFTSDRAGSPQVYRIAADGGRAERITFEGNYNASPVVSPDGSLLAVVHRSAQGHVIATQSLRGGAFRILTRTGNEERPSFSPNGSMILYATQDARGGG
jgi:TolB protein